MSALVLTADLVLVSKLAGASARSGVAVDTASSVEALVEKAIAARPTLIVLDLTTPGLDPRELVLRLRALSSSPVAIIAFGPHVQEQRLAAAHEAGCDEVLSRGQFHAQMDHVLRHRASAGFSANDGPESQDRNGP